MPNVCFPSINTKLDIKVPRLDYIKICGDIAKHNFMRLQVNVGRICRLLEANGHPIDEAQGYTVLGDFFQWFHEDIFVYHSSSIAAFLNNIRWAIFDYLTPEFLQSLRQTDELTYEFSYPTDCNDPLARGMYWDLMNRVRGKPYFPQFTVNPSLSLLCTRAKCRLGTMWPKVSPSFRRGVGRFIGAFLRAMTRAR